MNHRISGRARGARLLGLAPLLAAALIHCGDDEGSPSGEPDAPPTGTLGVDAGARPGADSGAGRDGGSSGDAGARVDDGGSTNGEDGGGTAGDGGTNGDGGGAAQSDRTIVAGGKHTCAIVRGRVKCWGYNLNGQLGNGASGPTANVGDAAGEMGAALQAVDLGANAVARSLALGIDHTCALLEGGQVKCWGINDDGQLGQGDALARGGAPNELGVALPPIDLGTGRTAVAIAAGSAHSCALLDDGSVKCWGANGYGQLGQGDSVSRGNKAADMAALQSISLPPGRRAVAVSAGGQSTCLLLDDNGVRCLGFNLSGQLGVGNTDARGRLPTELGAGLLASDLGPGTPIGASIGQDAACAVFGGGAVKCWGGNAFGQLGIGASGSRGGDPAHMGANLAAADLGPGVRAVAVGQGNRLSCALLATGNVKCWGANAAGQLGLGDNLPRGLQPAQMGASLPSVDLGAGRTAVELSVGSSHVCVRLDDATFKCWGDNAYGKLGLGDTRGRGAADGEMGSALPTVDVGP